MSAPPRSAPARPRLLAGIGRNVLALGAVSLLTDVSSEMIVPVLPLFVTTALGASVESLGWIEAPAQSAAFLLRIVSGWLSDRIGRRKPFILFGYGLSAVAKAAFAAATSWPAVLALRFGDRVGKGLRSPPRDALIADSVAREHLGRAFGFHRALDTLGAAIGPLLAFLLLRSAPGQFRRIFLISAIPAALALVVILAFVRAPRAAAPRERRPLGIGLRGHHPAFYRLVIAAATFSLANSSIAFLLLLAGGSGHLSAGGVTLVYFGFNIVYSLLSWPIGIASDRIGRRPMLIAAYLVFGLVYAMLAWRAARATIVAAFALLGAHNALLDGSQRSLVSDLVAGDRRATAFGFFDTVVGVAQFPASVVAGVLWHRAGPRVMLATDAALAMLAALLFLILLPPRREWSDRHAAAA